MVHKRSLQTLVGLLTARGVIALVSVGDPSDVIPPSDWAADNAIVPDYNVPFPSVQPSNIVAKYVFDDNSTSISHESFTVDANDTSVILVTDGADLALSHVDVIKFGYSSNLDDASFWGFNAAINVANASTVDFNHLNITVHNGAANIYSYGSDTIVNVTDAWLYSSGPVSHGLYASGNGTIYGANLAHFSGGHRSSSFSGDSPKGIIHVRDSVAHAQGIGSATYYALGEIFADNVVSVSEQGPVVFMDGKQNVSLVNCDATAGLLGGMVIFSSSIREAGASISVADSRIAANGSNMPGLWFGNVIADVDLRNTQLDTRSGVLVVANYSQVTQDFDYYASYTDNTDLSPAEVYITVSESSLVGDLIPYNESYISWNLTEYSTWSGATYSGYGTSYVDVALSSSSNWTLTATSYIQNLTDADESLANIVSNGYTLYYNSSALLNAWLGNRTISLSGNGLLTPGTQS
ncbi:hypothetical protein M406DRAFT_35990 [Cryphonectria parasitica EP155]|uniref:Uncharacterized protein n=1 Tax=Cryphonectria parasitica (strain ATCC 38755 / EP155) TaxID=660469 RepID=A0A9P5CX42_CRYP1|nr:uncharacterized protein M406DRAFT_35990 [Cryphonectria parasitica EP155]KAF3771410.1 hypothetical protein M406DRAFT_35990 [Cryphonectria parasitica EP155]